MPDVVSKAVQGLAEKLATEVSKNPSAGSSSKFEQLLSTQIQDMAGQTEMTEKIMQSFGLGVEKKPTQVPAISGEGLEIEPSSLSPSHEIRTQGKAMEILTEVNRGALQMDHIIELTTSGRTFTPPELLALQAGVHEIALTIDLTGKIVEQTNSSFKTVHQTNFA